MSKPVHERLAKIADDFDKGAEIIRVMVSPSWANAIRENAATIRAIVAELRDPPLEEWTEATLRGAMWSMNSIANLDHFWASRQHFVEQFDADTIARLTRDYTEHRARLLNATPETDDETWQLAHDLIARFRTCDSAERLSLVFSRNSFAIRAMPQGAFAGVVTEYLLHSARLGATEE